MVQSWNTELEANMNSYLVTTGYSHLLYLTISATEGTFYQHMLYLTISAMKELFIHTNS